MHTKELQIIDHSPFLKTSERNSILAGGWQENLYGTGINHEKDRRRRRRGLLLMHPTNWAFFAVFQYVKTFLMADF